MLVQRPRSLRRAILPSGFAKLKDNLLASGETKELARVLKLVLDYGIGEVEKAVLKALESNQYSYQRIYYYLNTRGSSRLKKHLNHIPPGTAVDLSVYDSLLAGEAK